LAVANKKVRAFISGMTRLLDVWSARSFAATHICSQ
jgi:hypothetical protein